ncbi:ABC transporter substrate-binding protein [Cohnella yongneupensis]|uniref:ABC transporter substrate-binding protein n=1 Tax=Cohnella yongneupensis TaxID=425006 RepID=A0ABW0QXI6_9BACL
MRKLNRTNAWVWVIALIVLFGLTSCTGSGNDAETSQPDHDKAVKLVGYLIGEAPPGMPAVLDAINAKLKKDINATLELNYIGWNDVATKYPLVLASGEDVDFIFAADWNFYASEATKGAFYPLDEDMLRTYMPRHMNAMPLEALQSTYIDGKPYMIPTSSPDRKVNVALFRKDIMEQAGMTEINRLSDIEPYLSVIKNNYPDMIPLNLDSQYDLPTPYFYLLSEKIAWDNAPIDSGDPMAQGIMVDMEDPSGTMLSMVDEPVLGMQKYAAGIMKDWYDKGYINPNPFANNVRSKDNLCNGKSGVAFGNSIDMMPVFASCHEKGIDIYPFPMLYPSGKTSQSSWMNNGVAISAHTKNLERTLEALDLLMEEPSYVYLTYFGVEGTNYVITPDDTIALPEGVTSEKNTYPPDAAGFWFVNKNLFKPLATWTDSYVALQSRMNDYLEPTTFKGFLFNSDNVQSEVAKLKEVSTNYAQSIYIGAVDNVDVAFDTLTAKLKQAGIDKVKAEVQQQADAYRARTAK